MLSNAASKKNASIPLDASAVLSRQRMALLLVLSGARLLSGAGTWWLLAVGLSALDLGFFASAAASANLCVAIGGLGIGPLILRALVQYPSSRRQILGSYWLLTGAASAIAWIGLYGFPYLLGQTGHGFLYALILFGSGILFLGTSVFLDMEQRQVSVLVSETALDFSLLLFFVSMHWQGALSLSVVATSFLIRNILSVAIRLFLLKRRWGNVWPSYSASMVRELWLGVWKVFPAQMLSFLPFAVGPWLLQVLGAASEAGTLGLAYRGYVAYAGVLGIYVAVLNPWLAANHHVQKQALFYLVTRFTPLLALLLGAAASTCWLLVPYVLPQQAPSVMVPLLLLLVAGSVQGFSEVATMGLWMQSRERHVNEGRLLAAMLFLLGVGFFGRSASAPIVAAFVLMSVVVNLLWNVWGLSQEPSAGLRARH